MTEFQRKVLDYIHAYWDSLGRTPDFRQIARHFGQKSPQGAHTAVWRLVDMGYLEPGLKGTRSSYRVAKSRDLSSVPTEALRLELQRRKDAA